MPSGRSRSTSGAPRSPIGHPVSSCHQSTQPHRVDAVDDDRCRDDRGPIRRRAGPLGSRPRCGCRRRTGLLRERAAAAERHAAADLVRRCPSAARSCTAPRTQIGPSRSSRTRGSPGSAGGSIASRPDGQRPIMRSICARTSAVGACRAPSPTRRSGGSYRSRRACRAGWSSVNVMPRPRTSRARVRSRRAVGRLGAVEAHARVRLVAEGLGLRVAAAAERVPAAGVERLALVGVDRLAPLGLDDRDVLQRQRSRARGTGRPRGCRCAARAGPTRGRRGRGPDRPSADPIVRARVGARAGRGRAERLPVADDLVRAVADRLGPGGPAPAERDPVLGEGSAPSALPPPGPGRTPCRTRPRARTGPLQQRRRLRPLRGAALGEPAELSGKLDRDAHSGSSASSRSSASRA